MRQRNQPLSFGGEDDPWYRPPPNARDYHEYERLARAQRRRRRAWALALVFVVLALCLWLRRAFVGGHALLTFALAAERAAASLGLRSGVAPQGASASLAAVSRLLGTPEVSPDATDTGNLISLDRFENSSWWWVGTPGWCAVERSTRSGVAWWDVRAHSAPAAPAVVWLDGLYTRRPPARLACHWSAALGMRIVAPDVPTDELSTSQVVMQLHRAHRRIGAEIGVGRTALLATSADAAYISLMSALRLGKSSAELPAALALASPLSDLDVESFESFRRERTPADPMSADVLKLLVQRILGRAPGSTAPAPTAATLRRLSPAGQELGTMPPTLLAWDEAELLADQAAALAERMEGAGVSVLRLVRARVGHGWLRRMPWLTSEGRADMHAIYRFFSKNGVR